MHIHNPLLATSVLLCNSLQTMKKVPNLWILHPSQVLHSRTSVQYLSVIHRNLLVVCSGLVRQHFPVSQENSSKQRKQWCVSHYINNINIRWHFINNCFVYKQQLIANSICQSHNVVTTSSKHQKIISMDLSAHIILGKTVAFLAQHQTTF